MNINKQTIFRIAGIASSVGSFWGTHGYLIHETQDQLLAVTGAGLLGGMIYFGLDIAFNHKRILPKITTAAIGLTLAAVSIGTVYQNINLPAELKAKAELEAQKQQAQNNNNTAIKAAYDKAAADRAAITEQKEQLIGERKNLEALNEQDRASITEREALIKKGIRPNGNNAEIGKYRAAMAERRERITAIQDELLKLTADYTAIKAELSTSVTPENTEQPAAQPLKYDTLARAALYDSATFLFLLFGAFYRRQDDDLANDLNQVIAEAKEWESRTQTALNHLETANLKILIRADDLETIMQENANVVESHQATLKKLATNSNQLLQQLQQEKTGLTQLLNSSYQHQQKLPEILEVASTETDAMNTAIAHAKELLEELNTANVRTNKTIAGANAAIAHTNARANLCTNPARTNPADQMDESEALQLLESQTIEPSDTGMITTAIIANATGWGRRKAESLITTAFENGLLARSEYGRGWSYFYPRTREESITNNVVSLAGVRS